MKPRSLKLSPDLEKSLTTYAALRGTSVSSVAREALEAYLVDARPAELRQPRSFSAQAADLAGCVNGPTDLSTNPAHLAGYGTSARGKSRSRALRP